MNQDCILCGKEIERGAEYTGEVGEALLHPVCLNCWKLCEKEPDRVLKEHREMIEKILADYEGHWKAHRFDRNREVIREKPSEPPSQEKSLTKRYEDIYAAVKATSDYAKLLKIVGAVFAALIIIGGTLALVGKPDLARNPLVVLGGIVAAATAAISFYWCGALVAALGQLLMVAADTAVNTSPLLSTELKAKEMEAPSTPERQPARAA
jgi:hypothetical protein